MGPHRLLKRIYSFLELNDDNDDDEGDDAEDDKLLFPVNKCWYIHVRQIQLYLNLTRGQSNLTKSASRGPIPRLGVTPGVEICTIEFLG